MSKRLVLFRSKCVIIFRPVRLRYCPCIDAFGGTISDRCEFSYERARGTRRTGGCTPRVSLVPCPSAASISAPDDPDSRPRIAEQITEKANRLTVMNFMINFIRKYAN